MTVYLCSLYKNEDEVVYIYVKMDLIIVSDIFFIKGNNQLFFFFIIQVTKPLYMFPLSTVMIKIMALFTKLMK